MGQFSWMFADTENKVALNEGHEAYLMLPHGGYLYESFYDGYGNFAGKDVYELVAEWNREYLATHPEFVLSSNFGYIMTDGSYKQHPFKVSENSWYKAYADLTLTKEEVAKAACHFRDIGIAIACEDVHNAAIPYPIKVCRRPDTPYDKLPPSNGDPNQGWGCDDDDDKYEDEDV